MSTSYGFFNDVNGDRTYDAETMGSVLAGFISNGIAKRYKNGCLPSIDTGMNITIGTGKAFIGKRWVTVTSDETYTIPSEFQNGVGYVHFHVDTTARLVEIVTLSEHTESDLYVPIAKVTVGASSVTAVEDDRQFAAPLVDSSTFIDTTGAYTVTGNVSFDAGSTAEFNGGVIFNGTTTNDNYLTFGGYLRVQGSNIVGDTLPDTGILGQIYFIKD